MEIVKIFLVLCSIASNGGLNNCVVETYANKDVTYEQCQTLGQEVVGKDDDLGRKVVLTWCSSYKGA